MTLSCPKLQTPRRPATPCGSPTSTRTSWLPTWSGSLRRRSSLPGTSTATAPGRPRNSLRSKRKSLINLIRRERWFHFDYLSLVSVVGWVKRLGHWYHPPRMLLRKYRKLLQSGVPRNSGKRQQNQGWPQVSRLPRGGGEEGKWAVGGDQQPRSRQT